jgi:DNA replication protein DnaC
MMPETRTCIKCGEEYEPKYWEVLGTKILRGQGNCPTCCKKLREQEEAKEKAQKEAEINDTRVKHIVYSGIPPKFQTAYFKYFEKGWQDKALVHCQKYAKGFPIDKRPIGYRSLYLWSSRSWGVGKTHLSCAIALEILNRWHGRDKGCPQIYFVSESDLFRQIQATYNFTREEEKTRDSEDDIIRKLTRCDLLILDDVGKERRADPRFVQRTLFGIIDGRYKAQLPIVLTANVNADGLRHHLEDASLDRFFEMTKGESVCMDGKSYRRFNNDK